MVSLAGLKAYYKFDEASGNLINKAASVGSLDAISTSDCVNTNVTQGEAGLIDDSYLYDTFGNLSIASSTSASDWHFISGILSSWTTITFWYKRSAAATSNEIILTTSDKGNSPAHGMLIRFLSTDVIDFRIVYPGGLTDAIMTVPTISDNQWHMICIRHTQINRGVSNMSQDDGTQVTADVEKFSAGNGQDVLKISQLDFGLTNTHLDEISLISREITDVERTSFYNGGLGLALQAEFRARVNAILTKRTALAKLSRRTAIAITEDTGIT